MKASRCPFGSRTLLKSSAFCGSLLLPLFVSIACSSSGDDAAGPDDGSGGQAGAGTGASSGTTGGGTGTGSTSGSGGEGGSDGTGGGRPVITGPRPPNNALGFYDIDAGAAPRAIRNDLSGDLAAMVQFAQSHTVDPSGNDAKNHPTLVSERAALVLVTPQNQATTSLEVEWRLNGETVGTSPMSHPNDIPRADSVNADGRPEVVYSKRAWSLVLPWDSVVPGLELVVRDDQGNEGTLGASDIEFASPAQLVLKVMRLGMLTSPPESSDHWMVIDPVRSASDYFETQPIAELVLGNYDTVELDRVMVSNGTIYDTVSATTGGVYDGDMRQDCAKSSYSAGVNNADQGIASSSMGDESNPRTTPQVVIHHAQGNYTNGVQVHGLSGGAGIGTLESSVGNELSHELGHNWGLGHYPGQSGDDYFWAAHHHESGWGFVQRRHRMRGNFDWAGAGSATVTNGVSSNVTWNDGMYAFNNDAMSGGTVSSSISRVTHHTGYSARISQQFFDRGIVSSTSPSGWVKWNKATRKLETLTPAASVEKPSKIGVPVYTFWGGYDPAASPKGVLYPALRGNYGHVFELPKPAASGNACWVDVALGNGSSLQVALGATRHSAGSVNKLHFNVAQSDAPQSAKLVCRVNGATTEIDSITLPAGLEAQPAAVRVGRDAGFGAYQKVELGALADSLGALSGSEIPAFDSDQWDALDKLYPSFDAVLSATEKENALRLIGLIDGVRQLDSWMTEYAEALDADDATKLAELEAKIEELGLAHDADGLLPSGQTVMTGGSCMTATADRKVEVEACDGGAAQLFIMDARGAIHSVEHLERCITAGASNQDVGLGDCDLLRGSQSFAFGDAGAIVSAQNPNQCLDNAGGTVLLYGVHGGSNQSWSGLTRSSSVLLAMLSAYNLPRLSKLAN